MNQQETRYKLQAKVDAGKTPYQGRMVERKERGLSLLRGAGRPF